MNLPCGKCYECKARRVSNWSYRLLRECDVSTSAYFVTLTYNVDSVSLTQKKWMTLVKADVQKFMKRLRKQSKGAKPLKYYLCGEYGGKFYRPHYHIILFNATLKSLAGEFTKAIERGIIALDGKTPIKCPSWKHGTITLGQVTEASVGYTLKYISKPKRIPLHKNDDRLPEFSLMSKGLGKHYIAEMRKWHWSDLKDRMYVSLPGGKKASMPRYYRDKIYTEEQKKVINAHIAEKMLKEHFRKDMVEVKKDRLIRDEKDRKMQRVNNSNEQF